MPITPLHLGPGSILKVAMGTKMSLMVFAFSQGLMDVEVIARVISGSSKLHGFTNTILGASVVLIPAVTTGKPVCEWALRWWNRNLDPKQARLLTVDAQISWPAAVMGAVLGVYSHWFLDALMHADADALWPIETGNRFISWMSISELNQLCLVTLIIGFAVIAIQRLLKTVLKNSNDANEP